MDNILSKLEQAPEFAQFLSKRHWRSYFADDFTAETMDAFGDYAIDSNLYEVDTHQKPSVVAYYEGEPRVSNYLLVHGLLAAEGNEHWPRFALSIWDGTVKVACGCSCNALDVCPHQYVLMEYVSRNVPQAEKKAESEVSSTVLQWLSQMESHVQQDDAPRTVYKNRTEARKLAPLGYFLHRHSYHPTYNISLGRIAEAATPGEYELISVLRGKPNKNSKYLLPEDHRLLMEFDVLANQLRYTYRGANISLDSIESFINAKRFFLCDSDLQVGMTYKTASMGNIIETGLGWRQLPENMFEPILEPNISGTELWSQSPLVYFDDKAACFHYLALPQGISHTMAKQWVNGPNVTGDQLEMIADHSVIKHSKKRSQPPLKLREVTLTPTVELDVSIVDPTPHYTRVMVDIFFRYDSARLPLCKSMDPFQHTLVDDDGTEENVLITRDRDTEIEVATTLLGEFDMEEDSEYPQFPGETYLEYYERRQHGAKRLVHRFTLDFNGSIQPRVLEATFFSDSVPLLQERGYLVSLPDASQTPRIIDSEEQYTRLEQEQDMESGIDWFRFDTGFVDSEGAEISLYEALAQFLEHNEIIDPAEVPEGETILLTSPSSNDILRMQARAFMELAQKVQDLFHVKGDKIDRTRAAMLADDFQLDNSDTLRALAALGKKLKSIKEIPAVKKPRNLQADLRDYQMEGFQWLQFLHDHQLNGVLADDMGLGKTLQTLTHLVAQKNAGAKHPSLVIAPTSVTSNWIREADKFAPTLKTVLLQGPERKEHWGKLKKYDLIVTSYALLPRDEEELLKEVFHTIVLDEAQYIKNDKSKASRIVCTLASQHRLCLSGTPLENHLGELWSLSRFLMPGLLGDQRSFRSDYRTPIEKHGSRTAQLTLNRKVAPLILRRTKDEVATELPPKTEITNTITLDAAQTTLYEAIRATMDEKVRAAINSKGVAQSQIVFLEALLKLRQTCCDPRLLKDKKHAEVPSAKFNYLTQDLLPTMVEEGRKVLLFSQFTTMLGLIEDHLKKEKIPYTKLTGATRKRDEAIAKFQDGDAQIFLISLKAGGTGLNLTAADTVIHYDPWWNPAAENQATDRAHRMGQTKPVFVHRLICAGSIEERIQELQKKKTDLAESLLSGSMKKIKLDEKTLGNLLAPLT